MKVTEKAARLLILKAEMCAASQQTPKMYPNLHRDETIMEKESSVLKMKTKLPNHTSLYQVADGRKFYRMSNSRERLFVKWQGKLVEAQLPNDECKYEWTFGKALYFVATGKVYKATFSPGAGITVTLVRDGLEGEVIDRGVCIFGSDGKFSAFRMCDDPVKDRIVVTAFKDLGGMARCIVHRGKAIFLRNHSKEDSLTVRRMAENVFVIDGPKPFVLKYAYPRDDSPFIYFARDSNLHILNTVTMEFLPKLVVGLAAYPTLSAFNHSLIESISEALKITPVDYKKVDLPEESSGQKTELAVEDEPTKEENAMNAVLIKMPELMKELDRIKEQIAGSASIDPVTAPVSPPPFPSKPPSDIQMSDAPSDPSRPKASNSPVASTPQPPPIAIKPAASVKDVDSITYAADAQSADTQPTKPASRSTRFPFQPRRPLHSPTSPSDAAASAKVSSPEANQSLLPSPTPPIPQQLHPTPQTTQKTVHSQNSTAPPPPPPLIPSPNPPSSPSNPPKPQTPNAQSNPIDDIPAYLDSFKTADSPFKVETSCIPAPPPPPPLPPAQSIINHADDTNKGPANLLPNDYKYDLMAQIRNGVELKKTNLPAAEASPVPAPPNPIPPPPPPPPPVISPKPTITITDVASIPKPSPTPDPRSDLFEQIREGNFNLKKPTLRKRSNPKDLASILKDQLDKRKRRLGGDSDEEEEDDNNSWDDFDDYDCK